MLPSITKRLTTLSLLEKESFFGGKEMDNVSLISAALDNQLLAMLIIIINFFFSMERKWYFSLGIKFSTLFLTSTIISLY